MVISVFAKLSDPEKTIVEANKTLVSIGKLTIKCINKTLASPIVNSI